MQNADNASRPTGLQVDLARRIATDIIARVHTSGSHLSEESLARAYQVSRTPVRSALKLLAQEGFIESRPHNGYFVCAVPDGIAAPILQAESMTAEDLYLLIINGRAERLIPDSFTDRDLQQRYAVPRSVLAKTLLRLSAEALIEKRKGHGWHFVHSLVQSEARLESYRFRAAVECGALLEPGFKADTVALQQMRARHEAVLGAGCQAIPDDDFFSLNADFHEALGRFSGNRFFLQTIQQQNQLHRVEKPSAFYRDLPRFRASLEEHLAIIGALQDNDREWAAVLMRRHLMQVAQAT